MHVSRPLKTAAATALASVVAAITLTGPMAGSAVAAPPSRTQPPTITGSPASPTSSTSASFGWTSPQNDNFTCSVDGSKPVACGSNATAGSYFAAGPFASGTHTFTVRAKLATGKSRQSTASVSWVVDRTAPQAPTVQQVATPTRNTSANVGFSDGDQTATGFQCQIDTGALQDCSPPIFMVPGPLGDGPHTAKVYAYDSVGNVSAAGSTTWTVDTTAPGSPTFSQSPTSPTKSTSATFAWTDSDPTATSFTCSVDGGAYTSCTSPKNLTNLAGGAHTFSVQGADGVGNVGPATSAGWTVDLTAPPAPQILSGPASNTDQSSAVFYFQDADATATFLCSLDGANFAACTSPLTFPSLADGSHTLAVEAVDQVGNIGPSTPYQWTIDSTGAVALSPVEFLTGPNAFSKVPSPTFTWTALDDTTTSFLCSLDGAPFTGCGAADQSGNGSAQVAIGTDGLHHFFVKASDGSTTSPAAAWSWQQDTVAPTTPVFSSTPPSVSNSKSALFSFASDANTSFTCKLDAQAATLCASPSSFDGLSDGSHTFSVTAADAAGNTSQNSVSWTIDTSAPTAATLTAPHGLVNSNDASLSWAEADPAITAATCTVDGTSTSSCSLPGSTDMHALGDGPHSFAVTVSKGSGGATTATTANWTVDTIAPALTVDGVPAGVVKSTTVTPTITQSDVHPGDSTCALTGPVTSNVCGSYVDLPDGDYTLTVNGSDAAGNAATPVVGSWTVDTVAPVLAVTNVPSGVVSSTSANPTIVLTDLHAPAKTCDLSGPVSYSTCGPYADLTDGAYTLTVDGTDAAGNAAVQVVKSWTVDTLAPVLQVTGIPSGVVSTTDVTPHVNQVDANAGNNGCILSSGGTTVATDCGPYTGLADGAYTLTVDGTDKAGNAATEVVKSWTVDSTVPTLEVTGVPSGVVSATTVNPVVTEHDANIGSFSCDLAGPQNSSNCGPYADLADGGYTLTVSGSDQAANVAAQVVKAWTVDTTAPVLDVTGLPIGTVTATGATPHVSQTDANPGPITCSLTGPTTVNTCGPITGLKDGDYTLTVDTTDQAGNKATTVTRSWTVDTTPPPAASVSGPAETTNTQPSFTFSDSEAAATLTCAVDGTFSSCSSPYALPTAVALGSHTFVVRATDAVGNFSDSTPFGFHVSPVVPVDSTPPTAAVKPTTTLTGVSTATFSETVHGLTSGGAALVLTGTTTVVPTTVACLSAGKVVACSGSFSGLRLTPRAALTPGQRYTVRLLAGSVKDAAGNPLTAKSVNFRGSLAEQETSTAVRTTWATGKAKAAYGGSFVRENVAGASATYTFTGTNVTWWTSTGRNQGKAAVFIDGVRKAIVNNYAAATHMKVGRKFTKLANKRHTIRIVVRGVKGAKTATSTFVTVDAFTVGKNRVNSPALTTTWRSLAAKQLSAGHASAAAGKGESLSFTFRGTGVSWVTERSRNQGKVAVYIDGVRKAVVDNYLATGTKFGVKRTLTRLADKVHTLKLVVLGTRHKGATGTWVTVDRFQVA